MRRTVSIVALVALLATPVLGAPSVDGTPSFLEEVRGWLARVLLVAQPQQVAPLFKAPPPSRHGVDVTLGGETVPEEMPDSPNRQPPVDGDATGV